MYFKWISALVMLLTLITACKTIPPAPGMPTAPSNSPNNALVYITDTMGGIGAGGNELYLDGNEIGYINSNEYTWFYVPPGEHQITLNARNRIIYYMNINAKSGSTYYFGNSPYMVSDAALLADAIGTTATGKQTLNAQPLLIFSHNQAAQYLQNNKLVGNSLYKAKSSPNKAN